jgi:hypothetical protein
MNWGLRIVLAFAIFAVLIFTMVFISMNQDINLVSTDYYKQEIEYEDQIQRERNTNSLEKLPEILIEKSTQQVVITFPPQLITQVADGYIHMFRPSDATKDKKYKLALDSSGIQKVSVSSSLRGLWKIKLYWNYGDQQYYMEKILTY